MAIRNILHDEHPVLRTPAQEVKKFNSAICRLLDDMAETMEEANGVGLAANQVGVSKKILIAAGDNGNIYELINPRCEEKEGEEVGIEGCLSVPGSYGEVPRATRVVIRAQDREGNHIRITAEGLLARILQHEMDHLEGVLFIDKAVRMVDPEDMQSEEKS